MNPSPEHVITFIEVVEHGSFTAAADRLGLSKSVISKHVNALEAALGAQLIKRSTRRLLITDIGHAYYQQVKNIPEQLQAGIETIKPFSDQPRGVLKVLSPTNFASSLKLQIVPNFIRHYPNVTLKLNLVRPVEEYLHEDFDIVIMWKLNISQFPDYPLVPVKLFTTPIGIYATPEYLKIHGEPQDPEALLQHNCLSSIGANWPFIDKKNGLYYLQTQGNLETTSDEIIHDVVLENLGIAYAYPFLYREDLAQGRVKRILTEYTNMEIELYAFYHPSPYMPSKIKAFIDELKQYYDLTQQEILERGS